MTTKDKTKSFATLDQSTKKDKEDDKRKRNDDQMGNKDIPLYPMFNKYHDGES